MEITARFGAEVGGIVRACTDADTMPKPPWRARKEAYLAHLEATPSAALLVSAADKLHNARAILADLRAVGPSVFSRYKGGRDGTPWCYEELVAAFNRLLPGPLADELAITVDSLRSAELAPETPAAAPA